MTKTTVAAFSGSVSSATMLDTDHDGKVDEIDVLFSVPVSVYRLVHRRLDGLEHPVRWNAVVRDDLVEHGEADDRRGRRSR